MTSVTDIVTGNNTANTDNITTSLTDLQNTVDGIIPSLESNGATIEDTTGYGERDPFSTSSGDANSENTLEQLSAWHRFFVLLAQEYETKGNDINDIINLGTTAYSSTSIQDELDALAQHSSTTGTTLTYNMIAQTIQLAVYGDRPELNVMTAYKERILTNQIRRNKIQAELNEHTKTLQIFNAVQNTINSRLTDKKKLDYLGAANTINSIPTQAYSGTSAGSYGTWGWSDHNSTVALSLADTDADLEDKRNQLINTAYDNKLFFHHSDFGFANRTDFEASEIHDMLKEIVSPRPNGYDDKNIPISYAEFLDAKNISWTNLDPNDTNENTQISNMSTAASDKAKLVRDDISIKSTELQQVSGYVTSSIEALTKIVSRIHEILSTYARSI